MKDVPFRERKIEYLIRRGRSPDGIPFILELDERETALFRIKYPRFALWSRASIMDYLKLELHHVVPDTDNNVRLMPNYIHCLLNLRLLHHGFHFDHKFHDAISIETAFRREAFLIRRPEICRFVNEVR